MLTEILLLLLVLAVAVLMVVDLARTRSEHPHGQTERPTYGAERAATVLSRGPGAGAVSPEPAASVTVAPSSDASLSPRPEGIIPPPGSDHRTGTRSADDEGSRSRLMGSDIRSRILLLAIIPAVSAVVVTLCVVRIAALLNGPSIHSQISSIHDGAVISVVVASAVLIVVLALGLWATIKTARFVLRPWQRLQAGVLQAAGSSDEIGEPASVFDQMRGEISRMTANEAQLRGKLSAMFVNLSHRTRSLTERQIRLIDNLERGEQDERRLADLAMMNRIAIHLHRNSENLLILAGQEPSTGLNQPVTLTYLVQAAASEIEEGERISFNVQSDIAVRGPAAGDVVHLLAELIQNATSFSSADMPVHITGQMLTTGGALLDITDRGIGMTAKEMAYANWQLENPPATDIDASKWMGLLVVARLAARHRIRVRLNPAESGGLTALVWLPDEIITRQGAAAPPMRGDLSSAGSAPGLSETALDPGYAPAGRTAAAARSAEFASAQGNPRDALGGLRPATDTGQRPGSAWSPGDVQPVSRAEPPVGPQAEQPVTARPEQPVTALAEQPATAHVEQPVTAHVEQPVTAQAEQPVTPQAEHLITLQAKPSGTVRSSGSGSPDATAGDAGVAGTIGDETAPVEVIVPPADDLARVSGPPIYDEMESHWFRSGRQAPASPGRTIAADNRWSSPADEGWQVAQTVDSPYSGVSTAAGLPRRLPNANLIPGSIPTEPPAALSRSAAAARDRFAGLQRGLSEGRAAASETADSGGKDES